MLRSVAVLMGAVVLAGSAGAQPTARDQVLFAARTGSVVALATYAELLERGPFGRNDRLMARACTELAAEAGHQPSRAKLAALKDALSASDHADIDAIKWRYFEAYGAPS